MTKNNTENRAINIMVRVLNESDTPAVRDAGRQIVTEFLKSRMLSEVDDDFQEWTADLDDYVYYYDWRGERVWLQWKEGE